jgi:hypothetical protein
MKNKDNAHYLYGLMFLLFVISVFHALEYFYLKYEYTVNTPHYDSIGSYMYMYTIMNIIHLKGFLPALAYASTFFLSWVLSFFPLIFFPILDNTPQSMMLVNTICIFIFLWVIYNTAMTLEKNWIISCAMSLIVFFPDAFYEWQGGLHDLQRDISFVCLLGATCFHFFSTIWKPALWKSLVLGFIAALTIWSRDNGIFWFIFIFCPIFGVWVITRLLQRDFNLLKKLVFPALIPFILMVVPFFVICFSSVWERMSNTYVRWAFGHDILASLEVFWDIPIKIFIGRIDPLVNPERNTLVVSLSLVVCCLILVMGLRLCTVIKFNKTYLTNSKGLSLLFTGIWIICVTIFVIIFYLKLTPSATGLSYQPVKHMFYTAIIGCIFIIFYFASSIEIQKSSRGRHGSLVFLILLFLMVLGASVYRTYAKTPDNNTEADVIARKLSSIFIQSRNYQPVVAFLWFDMINFDLLRYYWAQENLVAAKSFDFRHPEKSIKLDFAIGAQADEIQILIDAAQKQIISNADYIVCRTDPGAYSVKNHHYFLFSHGQQMVDSLLSDPRFYCVYEFKVYKYNFVVLKSKQVDSYNSFIYK